MKTKSCVLSEKAVFKIIYDSENGFVAPDNKVADFIKNQIKLFQEAKSPRKICCRKNEAVKE